MEIIEKIFVQTFIFNNIIFIIFPHQILSLQNYIMYDLLWYYINYFIFQKQFYIKLLYAMYNNLI